MADDQDSERQHSTQNSPPVEQDDPKTSTPEESKEELKEAIIGSHEILVSATTAFTLFPDTVALDRAKLTITKRTFFGTAEVMSMRIEDVLNVTASVGPIFGAVKILSRVLTNDKPYRVAHFWREDALRFKRITQGYIIALQRKIDCTALKTEELTKMLYDLGEDDHKAA